MNVHLHAQGLVRPEIKKSVNSLSNKALRAFAISPVTAGKPAVEGAWKFSQTTTGSRQRSNAMQSDRLSRKAPLAISYLFVPGNRPERFSKACDAGPDAIILVSLSGRGDKDLNTYTNYFDL